MPRGPPVAAPRVSSSRQANAHITPNLPNRAERILQRQQAAAVAAAAARKAVPPHAPKSSSIRSQSTELAPIDEHTSVGNLSQQSQHAQRLMKPQQESNVKSQPDLPIKSQQKSIKSSLTSQSVTQQSILTSKSSQIDTQQTIPPPQQQSAVLKKSSKLGKKEPESLPAATAVNPSVISQPLHSIEPATIEASVPASTRTLRSQSSSEPTVSTLNSSLTEQQQPQLPSRRAQQQPQQAKPPQPRKKQRGLVANDPLPSNELVQLPDAAPSVAISQIPAETVAAVASNNDQPLPKKKEQSAKEKEQHPKKQLPKAQRLAKEPIQLPQSDTQEQPPSIVVAAATVAVQEPPVITQPTLKQSADTQHTIHDDDKAVPSIDQTTATSKHKNTKKKTSLPTPPRSTKSTKSKKDRHDDDGDDDDDNDINIVINAADIAAVAAEAIASAAATEASLLEAKKSARLAKQTERKKKSINSSTTTGSNHSTSKQRSTNHSIHDLNEPIEFSRSMTIAELLRVPFESSPKPAISSNGPIHNLSNGTTNQNALVQLAAPITLPPPPTQPQPPARPVVTTGPVFSTVNGLLVLDQASTQVMATYEPIIQEERDENTIITSRSFRRDVKYRKQQQEQREIQRRRQAQDLAQRSHWQEMDRSIREYELNATTATTRLTDDNDISVINNNNEETTTPISQLTTSDIDITPPHAFDYSNIDIPYRNNIWSVSDLQKLRTLIASPVIGYNAMMLRPFFPTKSLRQIKATLRKQNRNIPHVMSHLLYNGDTQLDDNSYLTRVNVLPIIKAKNLAEYSKPPSSTTTITTTTPMIENFSMGGGEILHESLPAITAISPQLLSQAAYDDHDNDDDDDDDDDDDNNNNDLKSHSSMHHIARSALTSSLDSLLHSSLPSMSSIPLGSASHDDDSAFDFDEFTDPPPSSTRIRTAKPTAGPKAGMARPRPRGGPRE